MGRMISCNQLPSAICAIRKTSGLALGFGLRFCFGTLTNPGSFAFQLCSEIEGLGRSKLFPYVSENSFIVPINEVAYHVQKPKDWSDSSMPKSLDEARVCSSIIVTALFFLFSFCFDLHLML